MGSLVLLLLCSSLAVRSATAECRKGERRHIWAWGLGGWAEWEVLGLVTELEAALRPSPCSDCSAVLSLNAAATSRLDLCQLSRANFHRLTKAPLNLTAQAGPGSCRNWRRRVGGSRVLLSSCTETAPPKPATFAYLLPLFLVLLSYAVVVALLHLMVYRFQCYIVEGVEEVGRGLGDVCVWMEMSRGLDMNAIFVDWASRQVQLSSTEINACLLAVDEVDAELATHCSLLCFNLWEWPTEDAANDSPKPFLRRWFVARDRLAPSLRPDLVEIIRRQAKAKVGSASITVRADSLVLRRLRRSKRPGSSNSLQRMLHEREAKAAKMKKRNLVISLLSMMSTAEEESSQATAATVPVAAGPSKSSVALATQQSQFSTQRRQQSKSRSAVSTSVASSQKVHSAIALSAVSSELGSGGCQANLPLSQSNSPPP